MDLSVGPDAVFKLDSFLKIDKLLIMQCRYFYKNVGKSYPVEMKIDCHSNTVEAIVGTGYNSSGPNVIPERVDKAYFYFYIQGRCEHCHNSAAYSLDIETDILKKKVFNIGLEREVFSLVKEEDKFFVTLNHDSDIMRVSRFYETLSGELEDVKSIELPIVNIDCVDQAKTINKIKTLILFS